MSLQKICGCACDAGLWCSSVETLWSGFEAHRGLDGFDLCRRLGVPIRRSEYLKPLAALLHYDRGIKPTECVIILPSFDPADASAREGLLIYHEVAHVLLHQKHRFWEDRGSWGPKQSIDAAVEMWCDNFALAMLFAFFGLDVTDRTNAHAFLRADETAGSFERRNFVLGERMLGLCRKPPVGREPEPLPIFRLAGMLIEAGRCEGGDV